MIGVNVCFEYCIEFIFNFDNLVFGDDVIDNNFVGCWVVFIVGY